MRPKSASQYLLFLILISGMLWSQTPQITSVPAADANDLITVCEGDTLEFTAAGGGLFSDPKSYAFYVLRFGTQTPTVLQERSDIHTLQITSGDDPNQLQQGDQVFVRVWDQFTADGGGTFLDSDRRLTVIVLQKPTPILLDDTTGHVFCPGQGVSFEVLPNNGDRYEFYINGVFVQGGTSNALGPIFTLRDRDIVQVDMFVNGCRGSSSIQMIENRVQNGGSIGFSGNPVSQDPNYICYNTQPPRIESITGAQYEDQELPDTDNRYEWFSSVDGVQWNALNHHQSSYQPAYLTATTFFRRDFINNRLGHACEVSSNILQVIVAPENQGGTAQNPQQTLCREDQPEELVVLNGMQGPNIHYQWEESLDGIHFTAIENFGTSERYQPPLLTQTTYYQRRTTVLTQQCSSTSEIFMIQTISVDPGVLDPNQSRNLCYGAMDQIMLDDIPLAPGNPGQQAVTDAYTTLSYQWEFSTDLGRTWNILPHGNQKSAALTGPWTQTTQYRRRVIGEVDGVFCNQNISENIIQMTVESEIIPPNLDGPLEICENDPQDDPEDWTLNLSPIVQNQPLNLQWEVSQDGIQFNPLAGVTSLTYDLRSLTWSRTLYFWVELTHSNTHCQIYTNIHRVVFEEVHTLDQIAGPSETQTVCRGDAMTPVIFKYGGGAQQLQVTGDLFGSGLVMTEDAVNQTLTISGTPVRSTLIRVISIGNLCGNLEMDHSIVLVPSPQLPDLIYADDIFLKFGNANQNITYRICEGTPSTQFRAELQDPEIRPHINFVWELLTLEAGSIDRDTGRMEWRNNPESYTGTAQFRMAGINACGQLSQWTTFEVEVAPDQNPPAPPGAVSDIFSSGTEPTCRINTQHPSTQYQVGVTPDDTDQTIVGGVFWSLEVLEANNPDVPLPGTIDPLSGILHWNPGFYGSFNVIADPVNCEGTIDLALRRIRTVIIPDDPPNSFDIFIDRTDPNNQLPECAADTAGRSTVFNSNLAPQYFRQWSINNSDAGQMNALTGRLNWNPNFSGPVDIRLSIVQDDFCAPREQSFRVNIPEASVVTLTTAMGTDQQQLCNLENLAEIRYQVMGPHERVEIRNLPHGVTGNHVVRNQITQLQWNGFIPHANTPLTLQIENTAYVYTTQVNNESATTIAEAFETLLENDPTVTIESRVNNVLNLISQHSEDFEVQFQTPVTDLQLQTQQTQTALSEIVIQGAPDDQPGVYSYEITAMGGSAHCNSDPIQGTIEILPESTIQIISGALHQEVCNANSMIATRFAIGHAEGAYVENPTVEQDHLDGLPHGVGVSFQNGEAIIHGTPNVSIDLPTTYHYTLHTTNNRGGCAETEIHGSITVYPNQSLRPILNANTHVIQVCAGDPLVDVNYQLTAPLTSDNFIPDFSQFPPGITTTYSATTKIFALSGIPLPSPELEHPTDYPFSITVSSCSGVVTHTNILRVYPRPSISLVSAPETSSQELCTGQPLALIQYDLRGAQQFNFSVTPPAPWFQPIYDPATGLIEIQGTPQEILEGPATYRYRITPVGTQFNCTTTQAVNGAIRVLPEPTLILTSEGSSTDQSVCEGVNITPIRYWVSGGSGGISYHNFPPGIIQNEHLEHPQIEVSITGNTAVLAGEVYGIQFNEIPIEYHSHVGDTPLIVAQALAAMTNQRTDVSAQVQGDRLIFTGTRAGIGIQVSPYTSVGAQLNFGAPNPLNYARQIEISGAPASLGVAQQNFPFTIEINSNHCQTQFYTGNIEVFSNSTLNRISDLSTFNQRLCDGDPITEVIFEFTGAAQAVRVEGLPPGIQYHTDLDRQQVTFSGQTQLNVLHATTHLVTVTTIGNIGHCEEVSMNFSLEILPADRIQLISPLETADQRICADDVQAFLTPIRYQLYGTTDEFHIDGLPPGVVESFDEINRVIEINGQVQGVTSPTSFTYEIRTLNTECSSSTIRGTIHVDTNHSLRLDTAGVTANQTGLDAVCNATAITPIRYTFGKGAVDVTVSGLPLGVQVTRIGTHQIEISGTPDPHQNLNSIFHYTVTTVGGSPCQVATLRGAIEIYPRVTIDRTFIETQDISHLSCHEAQDGSIAIPSEPHLLDLRVSGGISDIGQIDHLFFTGQTIPLEIVFVEINGVRFRHTIVPQTAGGPPQTWEQILEHLINAINQYDTQNNLGVQASIQSTSTLALSATSPGNPFEINGYGVEQANSVVQVTHQEVVANRTGNYIYQWNGPNGFRSNSLSISDLAAGIYEFQVYVEGCTEVQAAASFELLQPDPLEVQSSYCDRAIELLATGGTGPYIFELLDENQQVLENRVNPSGVIFEDLTPGKIYQYRVSDQYCTTRYQESLTLPLSIDFDENTVVITHDSCQQNPNQGDGAILLNSGGNTFTGGSNQFEYTWSGPNGFNAQQASIDGLQPGIYQLRVRDISLGCERSEAFEITGVAALEVFASPASGVSSLSIKSLACATDPDAFVMLEVSGGSGNYGYIWERNGTVLSAFNGAQINNLVPGNYNCRIVDRNANIPCEVSYGFEVVAPEALSLYYYVSEEPDRLCQEEQIEVTLEILGGTPPYTLELNGEEYRTNILETPIIVTLEDEVRASGAIEFTVSDANDCTPHYQSEAIAVEAYSPVEIRATTQEINCAQGQLGSIELQVISGLILDPRTAQIEVIGPKVHAFMSWANTLGRIEGLTEPSTYQVQVTTQEGCVLFSEAISVLSASNSGLNAQIASITPPGCNGALGTIQLSLNGGIPPYTIVWESYESQTQSSTTTSITSTWVTLHQYQNQAIATGLEEGIYRVRVTDQSTPLPNTSCSNEFISQNIYLYDASSEVQNFEIIADFEDCTYTDLNHSILFQYQKTSEQEVDIQVLPPAGVFKDLGNGYFRFDEIPAGNYTLSITASQTFCPILYPFAIETIAPLEFQGTIQYTSDICTQERLLWMDPSLVEGGMPYEINDQFIYEFQWQYFPADNSAQTQIFVGTRIENPNPGRYELQIYDRNKCTLSQPVVYELLPPSDLPFSTSGILTSEDQNTVKSLAPSCLSPSLKGQIGVAIQGGLAPYQIHWYRLEVSQTTSTTSWVEMYAFANATYLHGLDPGKYRLEIVSDNTICETSNPSSPLVYWEEIIEIPAQNDVQLIDGPHIDTNLCDLNPGTATFRLYNSYDESLLFYYNNDPISVVNEQVVELHKIFVVEIGNPTPEGTIQILNEAGCLLKEIPLSITPIGTPAFEYTSANYQLHEQFLAGEEVRLTNTSEGNYLEEEWDFGDHTPKQRLSRNSATLSPVLHEYISSGTYNVSLRIFNAFGCFEELVKPIVIGKGYHINFPTVFTPNDDQFNDYFRPVQNGFVKAELHIYNSNGQFLYREVVEQTHNLDPLELQGWDGTPQTDERYYIYSFIGTLPSGKTVDRSGTFILLR